jgi:hypothetical protein
MKCLRSLVAGAALVCSGTAVHAHGDEGVRAAAPLLRSCKGKSAGAACSAKVARRSFDGICVAFPADPFEGALLCVPQPASCTTACGASGQGCCAPGNTCQSGLACEAGKCGTQPPACDVTANLIAAVAAGLPGVDCLTPKTGGFTGATLNACTATSSACAGPGCAATVSWGPISIAAGEVTTTANVTTALDLHQSGLFGRIDCTAILSAPVHVTVPATVTSVSGGAQLTVTGSPSASAGSFSLTGCSGSVDSSLLGQAAQGYLAQLQFDLGNALSAAVSGASASCP